MTFLLSLSMRPNVRILPFAFLLLLPLLLETIPTCHSFTSTTTRTPLLIRSLHLHPPFRPFSHAPLFSNSDNDDDNSATSSTDIDVSIDPRLYRIRLSRASGIEWGTDLSFSFVYVRNLEPSGAAALSGKVAVGDQICELRPVVYREVDNEGGGAVKVMDGGDPDDGTTVGLIGSSFDTVMGAFANLDRGVSDVDLVLFRGTKEELIDLCQNSGGNDGGDSGPSDDGLITITVNDSPSATTTRLRVPVGSNIRKVLTDNGINVYQSVTRWTNCKGKQLCGTCIVNVTEGNRNTNRKSMDEESTLRENPDGYRLSCVTFAYGDITVNTFPPVKKSQWTR